MSRWIWEKDLWPDMDGTVSKASNDSLRHNWQELEKKILALSPQLQRKFRNRMAGLEISASQAIENIHVAPGTCEDALINLDTPNSGWAFRHPDGGRDFDPKKPECLCRIMEDCINALKPIKDAYSLRKALLHWHSNLMGFGHNNSGVEGGKFRRCPVGISDGYRMIYIAPPADSLAVEMAMFENAFELYGTEPMDIVEAARMAAFLHLHFVIIHPYGDGNGRSTRLLELQGLCRTPNFGSEDGPVFAPADSINRKRHEYYSVLRQIQSFPDKNGVIDISHWLEWHTGILIDAIGIAQGELKNILNMA